MSFTLNKNYVFSYSGKFLPMVSLIALNGGYRFTSPENGLIKVNGITYKNIVQINILFTTDADLNIIGHLQCIDNLYTSHYFDYDELESFSFNAKLTSIDDSSYMNTNAVINEFVEKGWFKYIPLIEFTTYQLGCEKHVVDKTSYITQISVLHGILREEIDVLNPSLLLELTSFPTFNYLYIPEFSRYYFVTKITSIRNNIYRIDLHVDVLYSFKTDITSQEGLITRSQTGDSDLVDKRLPLSDIPTITITSSTDSGLLVNTTFDVSYSDNMVLFNYRYIAFTSFVKNNIVVAPITDYLITPPSGSGLPKISGSKIRNPCFRTFAVYGSEWNAIATYISNDDTLSGFVVNAVAFPFELTKGITSTEETIGIGNTLLDSGGGGITWKAPLMLSEISEHIVIADFTFSPVFTETNEYFLNYEPYSTYELFIPYYGWVKINAEDFVNQRIIVFYVANYVSGSADVFVYNMDDDRLIFSSPCQLGVVLAVSTSNQRENNTSRMANALNLGIGLLGSAGSIATGIAGENPLAVAGGLISATKSVVSFVNANAMLYERGSVTLGSTSSSVGLSQKVNIKHTYHSKIQPDSTTFKKLQGVPTNRYDALTSLTGYCEIVDIHYTPSSQKYITSPEIDEIVSLASGGIIL